MNEFVNFVLTLIGVSLHVNLSELTNGPPVTMISSHLYIDKSQNALLPLKDTSGTSVTLTLQMAPVNPGIHSHDPRKQ